MVRYGRNLLDEWMLDPSVIYLNHGTVGAPPRRVIAEQRRIQDLIERQPAQFQLRELADPEALGDPAVPHMRAAAAAVAGHLGAVPDDLVFVDNATTGVNAVLRSLRFSEGDEILVTSLGYGGVNNAVRWVCDTTGATMRTVALAWPGPDPDSCVAAVAGALTDRTRLCLVDHITSQTALVLPVAGIAAACRDAGVPVLVDGAHAPGAIGLDVASLGVDWYTANLHKWALAPRSCGILWADPRVQEGLHPVTISWGYGNGMSAEFDLLGTRDPSANLTAPFALDLLETWGGVELMRHNHDTVWRAARRLSDRWGTVFATPESMIGPMATIALPPSLGTTKSDADALRRSLLVDDRIEVPVFPGSGSMSLRLSAQIYNDDQDFDRLGAAIERRCA